MVTKVRVKQECRSGPDNQGNLNGFSIRVNLES
jgi:hypothetical protein